MIRGKQFVWTFFAMIVITYVTTIIALITVGRGDQLGPALMVSYLIILGCPLIVIIPFFAFRSIADEHSEETLNMVLVTTMRPSQIIIGKLCSAMLQAIIYLSVVAPCIAFTILLRGIDINQLMTSLGGVFLISVLLSAMGLCVGSIGSGSVATGSNRSNSIWQLIFALVLVASFASWWGFSYELANGYSWRVEERFLMKVAVATGISTGVLFLAMACAQITFPSENRSTIIRLAMLLHQLVFISMLFGFCLFDESNAPGDNEFQICMVFGMHYWLIMGAMMVAVPGRLSNRVKRSMPQTFLGALFGGLLMPGPGRGFLFAWSSCLFASAVCVFVTLPMAELDVIKSGLAIGASFMFFSLMLSVTYLLLRLGMRNAKRPLLVFGVLVLIMVYFLPIAIVESLRTFLFSGRFSLGATFLNYMSWFGTMYEINRTVDSNIGLMIPMAILSTLVTIFALLVASRELTVRSIATPAHVIDEDKSYAKAKRKEGVGETIDDIFAE